MIIRNLFRRIVYGPKADSKSYIEHLRRIGVKIGSDCTIYVPTKTLIDEQYPWLISIGDHVRITEGVKILTHDYSWSVLKKYRGGVFGASGCVDIGNNVFIGMNSIISKGVRIGDNVIIGTGSIVTRDCEEKSIYAGVPAKKIMSLDQFFEKRADAQIEEAKTLAVKYFEKFGKKPEKEVFHEYFMLFSDSQAIRDNKVFSDKIYLCGNKEQSLDYVTVHGPVFQDFEEFMRYCFDEDKK